MKRKSGRLCRALALLLAAALVLPLSGQMEAAAVTPQEELEALRQNSSSLKSQKKEIDSQLKAIRADKSKAQEQKALIEQQINLIQGEIDNIAAQIAALDGMIGEKAQEVADTEAREKVQYELFCQRIRTMEEEGETSYWSILFDSSDFSDLLDRFMMVEEIIEYDNGVMDSLIALREQITEQKAELETSKAEREEATRVQEEARQEQKAREAEVDELIQEISSHEDEL